MDVVQGTHLEDWLRWKRMTCCRTLMGQAERKGRQYLQFIIDYILRFPELQFNMETIIQDKLLKHEAVEEKQLTAGKKKQKNKKHLKV